MAKFVAAEYKKRLEASKTCESCEKVPSIKLGENTHYVFISYSHKDYKKVYADLADLYESEIPFWYDSGLPAGKNWDDVVRERMEDPRCMGIIFFLSENLFLSRSIQTELLIASGEEEDTKTRQNYFCVNLTDKQPSEILINALSSKQFTDTSDAMADLGAWVKTLTTLFTDRATYLPFDHQHHLKNLIEQIEINFGIATSSNRYSFGNAVFRSGNGVIEFADGSVYEGAFLNGAFSGHGKLRKPLGSVYEGNFSNGLFSGYGELVYHDGSVYKGQWKEGKRNGQGTMCRPDGVTYTGEWKDWLPHGKGTKTWPDGYTYTGQWAAGNPHGKGKGTHPDGTVYEGDWNDGWSDGQGTMAYANGSVYEGQWAKDKRHGYGKMTYPNGAVYEGQWVNGKRQGQCTFTRGSDGHKYIGGWDKHGSCGKGTYIYPDGASRSGIWDGETLLEGEGVMRYEDGSSYDGQIKNNLRHGQGTYILADGTVQTGHFENDVFTGQNICKESPV